jgi:hypothetical protein
MSNYILCPLRKNQRIHKDVCRPVDRCLKFKCPYQKKGEQDGDQRTEQTQKQG